MWNILSSVISLQAVCIAGLQFYWTIITASFVIFIFKHLILKQLFSKILRSSGILFFIVPGEAFCYIPQIELELNSGKELLKILICRSFSAGNEKLKKYNHQTGCLVVHLSSKQLPVWLRGVFYEEHPTF